MKYRVIDADAHTIEPPGMWERYLPAKFQDKAPKLVKDHKGGDAWEFQRGVTPMPIGMVTTAGQRYEEFDWFGHGYDDIRKGCIWDRIAWRTWTSMALTPRSSTPPSAP